MDRLTPIPRRDTSPPTLHRNVDTKSVEGILVPHLQDQAQQPPGEEDGEFLAAQIKALMMHLSEVWYSGMITFPFLARSASDSPRPPQSCVWDRLVLVMC